MDRDLWVSPPPCGMRHRSPRHVGMGVREQRDADMMSWAAAFQMRQHLRQSLWAVPVVGALAGGALARADMWAESRVSLPAEWSYAEATASNVLITVSGSMVGLVGLVVTIGVLVVQMATGTLSPRFMRLWYRDRLQKLVLASFTATFAFSFSLLRTVDSGSVPDLGVTLAGLAVTVDIVLLLIYLDRFVHTLRPVAVAAAMARAGLAVVAGIERAEAAAPRLVGGGWNPKAPSVPVRADRSGAIQAVNVRAVVALAGERDLLCCLRHTVGDFITTGGVLMDVQGPLTDADARRLRGVVALGHERTIDQDPAFAMRIIVDIAIRALSPAVNDPTTATQMINHLGELLAGIGAHDLRSHGRLADATGQLRLTVPTRTWDDYLELGISEIRQYGRSSPQICRRLHAMLVDLEVMVLPLNRASVRREAAVLEGMVTRDFQDIGERTSALTVDRQGIGGASQIPGMAVPGMTADDPRA
jgi:uncharacterized membrane protein